MTEDHPDRPSPDSAPNAGDGELLPGLGNDLDAALARLLGGGSVAGATAQEAQSDDLIITEPDRLAKKVPPEVPDTTENVVWRYDGNLPRMGQLYGFNKPVELPDSVGGSHPTVKFDGQRGAIWTLPRLPEGKRLVIDGIPRGNVGGDPANPPRKMQVHVYKNTKGFLVADEVADGQVLSDTDIGVRMVKDSEDAEPQYAFDPDVPSSRPVSTEGLKQYRGVYDTQSGTWDKEVQLLSMTSKWSVGERHVRGEIAVRTPDDAGEQVQITFGRCEQWRDQPLTVRIVPDSATELHPLLH